MAEKKSPICWEWIENQWQRGTLSNYQIAKNHEAEFGRAVDESAIRKRASSHGWQRDLDEAIRREARAKLAKEEVRKSPQEIPQDETAENRILREESELVDKASDALVTIELKHRKQLVKASILADAMEQYAMDALKMDGDGPSLVYEPGELKDVMGAASAAIGARTKVILLERKSFGMDEKRESSDLEKVLTVKILKGVKMSDL